MSISVIIATMNRTSHVHQSALAVSKLSFHDEHIIIDWGSTIPLCIIDLPIDNRIKLIRINWPKIWNLSLAYNIGFSCSNSDFVFKLDADIILEKEFEVDSCLARKADFYCKRLTNLDWRLANAIKTSGGTPFLAKHDILENLGGFNPYFQGWGWDEIDLCGRAFRSGCLMSWLNDSNISQINHGNSQRLENLTPVKHNTNQLRHAGLPDHNIMTIQNNLNTFLSVEFVRQKIAIPELAYYQNLVASASSPLLPRIQLVQEIDLIGFLSNQIRHAKRTPLVQRLLRKMGLSFTDSSLGAASLKDLALICRLDYDMLSRILA